MVTQVARLLQRTPGLLQAWRHPLSLGQEIRLVAMDGDECYVLASLTWQTVLAGVGAVAHHRLPPAFQVGISALGNLMIIGFAVALAGALV